MAQANDLSRSLVAFEQDSNADCRRRDEPIELAGRAETVPGIERQPLKKLDAGRDGTCCGSAALARRGERSGRTIARIVVAFEAGRDGFWLARWLTGRGIEVHVIHSTRVAVSRERKRAKTDRLDTAMLMRVLLGLAARRARALRDGRDPDVEEEDARRPSRERESLVGERTRIINRMKAALVRFGIRGFNPTCARRPQRLEGLRTRRGADLPPNTLDETAARPGPAGHGARADRGDRKGTPGASRSSPRDRAACDGAAPGQHHRHRHRDGRHAGAGGALAHLRDRRAVARYAGLTGSPDESGIEAARERPGQIRQRAGAPRPDPTRLALPDVPEGERAGPVVPGRTEGANAARKTTMIVALARKLLIALWRMVTAGEVPQGVVLRPPA